MTVIKRRSARLLGLAVAALLASALVATVPSATALTVKNCS
jgi:hypothetical protein